MERKVSEACVPGERERFTVGEQMPDSPVFWRKPDVERRLSVPNNSQVHPTSGDSVKKKKEAKQRAINAVKVGNSMVNPEGICLFKTAW